MGLVITSATVFIISCFVITVQSVDLTVDHSQLFVKQGDTVNLSCRTDQNAQFLISNPIHWEKVGRDGSRVVIATLANVVESLKDQYLITLPSAQEGMTFILSIKNGAEFDDDGYFKCIIKDAGGSVIAEAQTEVIVLKNMDKMTFELDSLSIDQTYTRAEPIYLEEGDYEPICKAMGSNPESVIKMYLNDMEIGADVTLVSVEDKTRTSAPRVFNTEKKVLLKLTPDDKDKILKCVAIVHDDGAMQHEVSFKLDIFSVDPEISCDNSSAVQGARYVELRCNIKLKGVTCSDNMENIFWENGNSGEQYKISSENSKYSVFCEDIADTEVSEVKSTLRIKATSSADFETSFFLIYVNKHNTSKKKEVPLTQRYNSASRFQIALYLLCSTLLAAIML